MKDKGLLASQTLHKTKREAERKILGLKEIFLLDFLFETTISFHLDF